MQSGAFRQEKSNEQVLIATYLESNKILITERTGFDSNLFRKQQDIDSKKELVVIATYLESNKILIAR